MNTLFSPRTKVQNRAFSLLEVAFALVIFVIGALAILRIFPTGLSVLETSGNRRTGARVADDYVARSAQHEETNAPEAVYNAEYGSSRWNWTDFPGSMASTKQNALSMPRGLDDVDSSALGNLRFISGRRVPVAKQYNGTSYVVMPDLADRRTVFVSREGLVKGVSISSNGELDFANATYERSDLTNVSKDYPFHEPTVGDQNAQTFARPIPDQQASQNITLSLTLGSPAADVNLAAYCTAGNQNISGSPKPSVYVRAVPATTYGATAAQSATDGTDYSFGNGSPISTATGQQFTFTTPSLSIPITIYNPSASPSTENKYFYLELFSGRGVSILYKRILVCIQNGSDTVTDPATTPVVACAVRPPWWLRVSRTQSVPYYFSYQYTNGTLTEGINNEALIFPADDTAYPQSCDPTYGAATPGRVLGAYRGISTIIANTSSSVRFRQPLQNYQQFWLSTLQLYNDTAALLDVTNVYNASSMTYASLDYSVRGWDFLSDVLSSTSAPLTQVSSISSNSDYDWINTVFLFPSYNNSPQNIREYQAPFGNLQNPMVTTVFWKWSNGALVNTWNSPTSNIGSASFKAASAKFAKEGRFYFPISYYQNGSMGCPTTENSSGTCTVGPDIPFPQATFSITYRSKDGWTRQLGVVADRYMPYIPDSAFTTLPSGVSRVREPWREYVFTGGKLYFHASEAGKTVAVKFASGAVKNIELDDDLVSASALGAGNSGFVDIASNPQGKVAVSLETLSTTDGIVDVGSPDTINNVPADSTRDGSGSGIVVRTAWQNGSGYSSTYASNGNVSR